MPCRNSTMFYKVVVDIALGVTQLLLRSLRLERAVYRAAARLYVLIGYEHKRIGYN